MSDRPRRKRKQNNVNNKTVSNVHYVGYVEDEESVEAIMKKFEELDRIQREFQSMAVKSDPVAPTSASSSSPPSQTTTDPNSNNESHDESSNNTPESSSSTPTRDTDLDLLDVDTMMDIPDTSQPLTEEQLQEVFKRTSAFSVKSAMMDSIAIDDMDDMELWQVEFNDGNTEEIYEEDDYIHVDDAFWDLEFGEVPRKKGRKLRSRMPRVSTGQKRIGGGGRYDRERILERYKIMQVQVQDRDGSYYMVKKRVSMIDPSLPTYVRIPGDPIPRSWAHSIMQMDVVEKEKSSVGARVMKVKDILSLDLTTFGKNFVAVYMDPPLLLPDEAPTPGKIHIHELARLNIDEIVKAGFLFIWVEKEWIRELVRITQGWGFKYVENFCWIKKNINNQISRKPSAYFNKSKLSLLIFRKEGDTELRHQRNPDCVFDYIKPPIPGEMTEAKPAFIYNVMETLLPTAAYHPVTNPNGERLLELWGKRDQQRTGWTTIIESHST